LIPEHLPETGLATTCFQAITYSNAVKIVRISRAVGSKSGLLTFLSGSAKRFAQDACQLRFSSEKAGFSEVSTS
jgi:hypothetical protein